MRFARPLAVLLAASFLGACGSDDEPAARAPIPNGTTSSDPQRVGVIAGAPAANIKIYCKGLGRKTVPEVRASAFSICMESVTRVRTGRAKSARAACKGLRRKRVKALRGSPRSICLKATRAFLRDKKRAAVRDDEARPDDEAPPEDEFVLDDDGEEVPLDDVEEDEAESAGEDEEDEP